MSRKSRSSPAASRLEMMRTIPRSHLRTRATVVDIALLAALCVTGAVSTPGCAPEDGASDTGAGDLTGANASGKQPAYLRANAEGLHHFRDVPLGNVGMPLLILRLLPDVVPGKFSANWGDDVGLLPAPKGDEFASPEGTLGLPYGFGWATNNGMTVATITCAACHTGGVVVDGELRYVTGAPNTRFNTSGLREKFYAAVSDPRFTLENVKEALSRKPLGWLYPNDPAREGVESALVGKLYETVVARIVTKEAILRETSLSHAYKDDPDLLMNGTPGQADIFAVGGVSLTPAALLDPSNEAALSEFLVKEPLFADFPSVWNENVKARPAGQWDGFVTSPLLRNIASAVGNIGIPEAVDFENVRAVTHFLEGLPPPVYPFANAATDSVLKAGRAIYKQACSSCHDHGTPLYSVEEAGTDPYRARGVTKGMRLALRDAIRASCADKSLPECTEQSADRAVLDAPGGYTAGPLDGIWARAPYLHNGSVPTLRQLLIEKERPVTFHRGNYNYDTHGVGFEWRTGGTAVYDTQRIGHGNGGHSGPAFSGKYNFAKDEGATEALLAYLKTL